MNMVAIADGKPQQMGLLDIIRHYVAYQREVVLRRTKFDLAQAKERCHILEGLIVAVRNIDEVVQIIKTSESVPAARQRLRERFKLSERQAQAILDLRLARLTKLEVYKLEQELEELKKLIARLTAIVESKKLQMQVVQEELRDIKRRFKSERRSVIVGRAEDIKVEKFDDVRPSVPCVLCCSAAEELRIVQEKNFNQSDKRLGERAAWADVWRLILHTSTDKTVYSFTDRGNCHKLDLRGVDPGRLRDKGRRYRDLFPEAEEGERPVAFFAVGEELPKGCLLFYTRLGYIKKSEWKEYGVVKSSFQAVKLNEGDAVLGVEEERADAAVTIFFVTAGGMCLNAYKNDVPAPGDASRRACAASPCRRGTRSSSPARRTAKGRSSSPPTRAPSKRSSSRRSTRWRATARGSRSSTSAASAASCTPTSSPTRIRSPSSWTTAPSCRRTPRRTSPSRTAPPRGRACA